MTRIDLSSPGSGNNYLYYLLNPATGANNVVISVSISQVIYGVSASYTGVRQSGVPDASGKTATDPTTSVTTNVTTVAASCWLVSTAGRKTGGTGNISAGANTVSRQINTLVAIGDSNIDENPPGSFGQTWTLSASSGLDVIVASFAPTGVNSFRSLLGVGQ